jgi:hypothetical protein
VTALAWLYLVGAALELVGLGLVAWDVHDSAQTLTKMSGPHWLAEQRETGQEERSLFQLIAEVAAGNLRRRAAGVG